MCLGPWSGVMAEGTQSLLNTSLSTLQHSHLMTASLCSALFCSALLCTHSDWFGMTLPMEGVKSTSVVYRDLEPIRTEPYACFCAEDVNDCHLELYPRPNGEVLLPCTGDDCDNFMDVYLGNIYHTAIYSDLRCSIDLLVRRWGQSVRERRQVTIVQHLPEAHSHSLPTVDSDRILIVFLLLCIYRLRAGGDCESADMIVADPKRVKAAGDSFRMMSSLGDREPDQVQVRNCTAL